MPRMRLSVEGRGKHLANQHEYTSILVYSCYTNAATVTATVAMATATAARHMPPGPEPWRSWRGMCPGPGAGQDPLPSPDRSGKPGTYTHTHTESCLASLL